MKRLFLLVALCIPYIFYAIYSYAQLDPNLVLSTFPLYWRFQEFMWQIGYHQRELSTGLYVGIIFLCFLSYALALRWLQESEKFSYFLTVILILLGAHNALSHDLFNYLFNARMVVKYGMNPHLHVALEFPSDDWIRFMHNTHTAAPYGYLWTVFTVPLYALGGGVFTVSLMIFKTFMVAGLVLLWKIMQRLSSVTKKANLSDLWIFILNPLVLIETVGNGHNDVWMMLLALFSFVILLHSKRTFVKNTIGMLAFIASACIKYATIALLPFIVVFLLPQKMKGIIGRLRSFSIKWWPELSAIAVFIPLLTARSQWFHPWYLIWSLCFLPFIKQRLVRSILLALSFSSMLRYAPYLLQGDFQGSVLSNQILITWLGGVFVAFLLYQFAGKPSKT
jgi:hypothetical protein